VNIFLFLSYGLSYKKMSYCARKCFIGPPFSDPDRGSFTKGGRLSTIGLLVLTVTSFDQLIFTVKLLSFFTIQGTLMKSSTFLTPPLQLVVPEIGVKRFLKASTF
jgi:hypothetical protein